ncbi:MAG: hypothetical protein JWO91_3320 [Acidobacteriaceae bacterium]|jgi:hypothetical protein|nr:hypothetical protein [Acidobacteriaceae bacterium]
MIWNSTEKSTLISMGSVDACGPVPISTDALGSERLGSGLDGPVSLSTIFRLPLLTTRASTFTVRREFMLRANADIEE